MGEWAMTGNAEKCRTRCTLIGDGKGRPLKEVWDARTVRALAVFLA